MSLQSNRMEIRQLHPFIIDDSRSFPPAQSHLPIHDAHGTSSEFIALTCCLRTGCRGKHSITNNSDQVFSLFVSSPATLSCRCVIRSLCESNRQFQRVNPTSQVALTSTCLANCPTPRHIVWNVYHRTQNSTANHTEWTLFNNESQWFFGK